MKTENTLRTVRNSLLCFFTALGAGLLVACGSSGGGGAATFPAYFVDAAVEGAEYSSPTRPIKDMTGENGEFEASNGVFEFSVGATTLGSVRLSGSSDVTPFDFIDVDRPRAIEIARIVQGLDSDGDPRNGILISQSTREGLLTVDLFANADVTSGLATSNAAFSVTVGAGALTLTIRSTTDAENHLVATHRCLYSGGYAGSYRQTAPSDSSDPLDEGILAFVFEPSANRLRGVYLSDVYPEDADADELQQIGVTLANITIGRAIALTPPGNELTFVSSRLITGKWLETTVEDGTESGTYELALVAGDPSANRRVVGIETNTAEDTVIGLYVLDYFANDSEFRGQYYDVANDEDSTARLTVAGAPALSWPTEGTPTIILTLSGTSSDDGAVAVTVEVVRDAADAVNNYGTFSGSSVDGGVLSGSWCDLRTTITAAVVSGGALVESLAMSHSRIGGDVSTDYLSRYLDSGFPANTAIDGIQILG